MPTTPLRNIRVPDDVWAHAKECSDAEHVSVSAYVVKALRAWKVKK
jgi:hypothetical protein